MKKIILSLILIPSFVFADCPANVQLIKKGDIANCSGFLFSDQAEKLASDAKDDAAFYKELSDKLTVKVQLEQKESDLLQQRLTNYRDEAQSLAKELGGKQTTDGLYRMIYFFAGVAITGYIAHNVR